MKHRLQFRTIKVNSHIYLPLSMFTVSTNCIVIWRKSVAVVVDPGGESQKISRFLKRAKLKVGAYWLTHAHPDHVGGLSELIDLFPAPVRCHRSDNAWLTIPVSVLGSGKEKWLDSFGNIKTISCGDIVADVIISPGHTCGSVCYWFKDAGILLTGDTLFHEGVGLTWYPGGDSDELSTSLRRIFRTFPDETVIIPGHGKQSTIGHERPLSLPAVKKDAITTIRKKLYAKSEELSHAFSKVRSELRVLGLLHSGTPLDDVVCVPEDFSVEAAGGIRSYEGFYHPYELDGDGFFRPEGDGNIHVPLVFPEFMHGARCLLDTLRHEFGHALQDRYRRFFRGGVFKAAFGKSYGTYEVFRGGNWEDEYVSKYASTMTQEDFAETFMLFMKHKGKLPPRYRGKRAIEKKWKAVARIVKQIAAKVKSQET